MSKHIPKYGSALEHAIVRTLIASAHQSGFVPVAVFDSEEYQIASRKTLPANTRGGVPRAMTVAEALDSVFSVDNSTLHFAPADNLKGWGALGVYLVGGNGVDLISDYHVGNDAFTAAIDRVCDGLLTTRRRIRA